MDPKKCWSNSQKDKKNEIQKQEKEETNRKQII